MAYTPWKLPVGRWSPTRAKTILGENFASLTYGNCKAIVLNVRFMWQVYMIFTIEKFPSLVLRSSAIMQNLIIKLPFYYMWSGRLREVKLLALLKGLLLQDDSYKKLQV